MRNGDRWIEEIGVIDLVFGFDRDEMLCVDVGRRGCEGKIGKSGCWVYVMSPLCCGGAVRRRRRSWCGSRRQAGRQLIYLS